MSKAILGRKLGMTQIFTEEGQVVPVTVIESGNNVVIQSKTVESDGYNAVQLGFGEIKEKHLTKPLKGRFGKAGVDPVKFIREMRLRVIAQLAEDIDDAVILVRHELVIEEIVRLVRELEEARMLLVDEFDSRQEIFGKFIFHGMSLPFIFPYHCDCLGRNYTKGENV